MIICKVAASTFLRCTCVCLLSLSPLMNIALKRNTHIKTRTNSTYSHLKVTYHLYDFSDYTPKGEQVFWVAVYRGLVFTLGYHLVFKKKHLYRTFRKYHQCLHINILYLRKLFCLNQQRTLMILNYEI